MHVRGDTELGDLGLTFDFGKIVGGFVPSQQTTTTQEPTNWFGGLLQSGFQLYDRVVSMESAQSARKRSEELAKAQVAARVAEAEAAKRRAAALYRPPVVGAPRRRYLPAGMDMTTMAMWGGGGLLAIVLITQLMRRK